MDDPFHELPRAHYRAILANPPWRFRTWDKREAIRTFGDGALANEHYRTMPIEDIRALPVGEHAAADYTLFLWVTWPNLLAAFSVH